MAVVSGDERVISHRFTFRHRYQSILAVLSGPLLVVSLCLIRSPQTVLQGRFWAEDAVFYNHSLSTPGLLEKIFYVYKGHLELLTSLTFALASYLHPKMVPLITGSVDLFVESFLAGLIMAFRKDLRFSYITALSICSLLVMSSVSLENYLALVNGQWLISALMFVIISLPEDALRGWEIKAGALTIICGVSSVGACFLFPLAVLYAICRPSKSHIIVSLSLLFCCIVQGAIILTHQLDSRFLPVNYLVFLMAPFFQIVVKHLLGFNAEEVLTRAYWNGPMAHYVLTSIVVPPVGLLIAVLYRIWKEPLSDTGMLLISFLYITLFNEITALGDRNGLVGPWGMRYFFLPGFVVAFILAKKNMNAVTKTLNLGNVILILSVAISAFDFFGDGYNEWSVNSKFNWRASVDECHSHPTSCKVDVSPGDYPIIIPERMINKTSR